MKITGTTKKQAKQLIQPLIQDIEELKKDLKAVVHSDSILVIKGVIESKEELLQAYKSYVGEKGE